MSCGGKILLFDVDGTLTLPRQVITPEFYKFLTEEVKTKCPIGLVGGSDLSKILEQMGGKQALSDFEYLFAENGLVAYHQGNKVGTESIQNFLGDEKLQEFINFSLAYMSKLKLPRKRGTFVEFRNGMINLCPVGRSCSQEERNEFAQFDQDNKIRENFVQALRKEFPKLGLQFSIGGQISIDAFPVGWDKTFCLKFLQDFQEIHFFGDKTFPGGNDYEIFSHERTIGHKVESPEDTKKQIQQLLGL